MKIKNIISKIILALLIILIVLSFIKVPYQVNMPGGLIDLGSRVTVNGETTNIEGSFNMAYVSVIQKNALFTLYALINPDWEIEKISDVKYDNETIEDANNRSKIQFEQSRDYAIKTALDAAGIENEIINLKNNIVYIAGEAKTDLKYGDVIIECNGKKVNAAEEIRAIIKEQEIGSKITFKILRDEKEEEATAEVITIEDEKMIGITILTTFDVQSELDINIDSKSTESGPSGGMMMALMTYNAVTKQDLTHGKKIVGTGTINLDGTVGEIGGVNFKVMGAAKENADIFLVPEENYEEALQTKKDKGYDIEIVKVKTLQDAIDYLEGIE